MRVKILGFSENGTKVIAVVDNFSAATLYSFIKFIITAFPRNTLYILL